MAYNRVTEAEHGANADFRRAPTERMTDVLEKLDDYQQMGIPAIWVIEPKKPAYYLYSSGQLTPTAVFELAGTGFRVEMAEIAAMID